MSRDLIQAALKDILDEKQDHVAGSIAYQRMERAEAVLRSVQLPLSPAMCALIESGQVEDSDADLVVPQEQALPADCDVRKIMLRVDPGEDGEGVEVYARNNADVVALLGELGDKADEAYASQLALPAGPVPELEVWYGSMPESNGKSNFTATLRRKGASLFDTNSYTFARSEYPERVRYEADRMRFLIGEIDKEQFILDYDADKHSGYVEPASPAVAQPVADEREFIAKLITEISDNWPMRKLSLEEICAKLQARAALCQPAEEARPTDCTRDPQCCPQNEGHGCQCSALAAKDKPC